MSFKIFKFPTINDPYTSTPLNKNGIAFFIYASGSTSLFVLTNGVIVFYYDLRYKYRQQNKLKFY